MVSRRRAILEAARQVGSDVHLAGGRDKSMRSSDGCRTGQRSPVPERRSGFEQRRRPQVKLRRDSADQEMNSAIKRGVDPDECGMTFGEAFPERRRRCTACCVLALTAPKPLMKRERRGRSRMRQRRGLTSVAGERRRGSGGGDWRFGEDRSGRRETRATPDKYPTRIAAVSPPRPTGFWPQAAVSLPYGRVPPSLGHGAGMPRDRPPCEMKCLPHHV